MCGRRDGDIASAAFVCAPAAARPITLLGVTALGEPDLMVEVEATAVLD